MSCGSSIPIYSVLPVPFIIELFRVPASLSFRFLLLPFWKLPKGLLLFLVLLKQEDCVLATGKWGRRRKYFVVPIQLCSTRADYLGDWHHKSMNLHVHIPFVDIIHFVPFRVIECWLVPCLYCSRWTRCSLFALGPVWSGPWTLHTAVDCTIRTHWLKYSCCLEFSSINRPPKMNVGKLSTVLDWSNE